MALYPVLHFHCFIFALILLFFITISDCDGSIDLEDELCKHVQLNPNQPNEYKIVRPSNSWTEKTVVFCYPGQEKIFRRMWTNPKISLEVPNTNTDFDVYFGNNFSEVVSVVKAGRGYMSWWSTQPFFKPKEHSYNPFNSSCIGISSCYNCTVKFQVKNPELWYVLYTVLGLLIFFTAPSTSRNIYLHYGTGVMLGVVGSILIVVFIISKFLPQKLKTLGYAIGIISTSASMFLLQYVTVYLNDVLINNWQILLSYVFVSSLVSFAMVHRYGPVSNPRTLDIIRWSLQLSGLTLAYQGTQIAEASIAIILVAVVVYNFPCSFFLWLRRLRLRYFPEKLRFLTPEEYYEEKERVTKESLKELRDFCRSPDCNAWKTISRLSTPSRFASFVEGDSHISHDEFSRYRNGCALPPSYDEESSGSEESDLSHIMEVIAKQHPD